VCWGGWGLGREYHRSWVWKLGLKARGKTLAMVGAWLVTLGDKRTKGQGVLSNAVREMVELGEASEQVASSCATDRSGSVVFQDIQGVP